MNSLESFEWGLAVYVASTIHGDTARAAELERRLTNLGVPAELLDNIRRSAGVWSVSDDDHIEMIVAYAAKFSREPGSVDVRDIERLEAIGIARPAIRQLNSAVAFVGQMARAADTSP
jgi:uncharacterized protein YciW